MKITKKTLKDLISEVRDANSGETYLLSKPVFEHELAKKIFEEQSASGGKFTEVAFNSMTAAKVFADEALEESETASLEFEASLPSNPNPEVIERFHTSLYSGARSGFLTYYSKEELADMHLYILKGHNAGFALKGGNDIVSVHNNSELRGLSALFLRTAKEKGGTMLDHFDGFLSGLYRRYGFTDVYEVYQWEEQYRPDAWTYDTVDVFNENTSIYSDAMKSLLDGSSNPQGALPNEEIEVTAEDGFKIMINPNLKYNQYLYGRPDVIMRRL